MIIVEESYKVSSYELLQNVLINSCNMAEPVFSSSAQCGYYSSKITTVSQLAQISNGSIDRWLYYLDPVIKILWENCQCGYLSYLSSDLFCY